MDRFEDTQFKNSDQIFVLHRQTHSLYKGNAILTW